MLTRTSTVRPIQETALLNFVVVGQVRSGSAIVQSSLDNLSAVTCHNDLFHSDAKVRQRTHERYFGPASSPDLPTWYMPGGETNPFQYLSRQVFDQNKHAESAIGVRLTYDQINAFQFYDLLHERCMEGDFCLIHVRRNPVSCFVSQQQAKESGLYAVDINDRTPRTPPAPLTVNLPELVAFVRQHEAIAGKIDACCDDTLDITYRELSRNLNNTMRRTLDFLEQSTTEPMTPASRRLPNHEMAKRIANLDELRRKAPADVREFLLDGALH